MELSLVATSPVSSAFLSELGGARDSINLSFFPLHQLWVCVWITDHFPTRADYGTNRGKCLPVTVARVTAVAAASKIRMELRNFMIDGGNICQSKRRKRSGCQGCLKQRNKWSSLPNDVCSRGQPTGKTAHGGKSGEKARLDLLTRFRPHQKRAKRNKRKTRFINKKRKADTVSLSASCTCETSLNLYMQFVRIISRWLVIDRRQTTTNEKRTGLFWWLSLTTNWAMT